MTMMKKYFTNLKKYQDKYGSKTLLLWQCGSFFEVYALKNASSGIIFNSNIENFGSICDYSVKDKKTNSTSGKKSQRFTHTDGNSYIVMMSGMPTFGAVESKISKLNDHGFTVALWKQKEVIKDQRYEFAIFSPGTKFQDNNNLTNNIMCISLEIFPKTLLHKEPRISCGLSIIDIISGETKFYEYHTSYFNESINYDEIERFNSIYNPSEIIIIHNFESESQIKNMIEFSSLQCDLKHILSTHDENSVHITEIKNSKKQTYQLEIFQNFYKNMCSDFFYAHFAQYPYATESFCFLLNFVYQHQKNLVKNIKVPDFDNNPNTLILANHSLKQLNIINNGDSTRKYSSVLKFLNNCSTAMGKRLFKGQLLHPSCDVNYLNSEYNIISHCINREDTYFGIIDNLKKIGDLDKFYRKIILEKVTPANIYNFYNYLNVINKIWKEIKNDETMLKYLLEKINPKTKRNLQIKKTCDSLLKEIKATLELDICSEIDSSSPEQNIFKSGVYSDVDNSLLNYDKGNSEMNSTLSFLNMALTKCEKKNKTGIKLHVKETMKPHITTTNRRALILKDLLPKYGKTKTLECNYVLRTDIKENFVLNTEAINFVSSTKSNMKITSNQIDNLCETIYDGKETIKKAVKRSYKKYMGKILSWSDSIETLSHFVKLLDIVVTKAKLAVDYKYCKPEIKEHEKSFFEAKNMRHLLIEHIQEDEIYTPNDVCLGKSMDGVLLFGTNAVGKSSLIKSIGICTIMAQAGMYVPCSKYVFNPYKSLYTRILGNDDIFKGLSSFAVEMSELKSILKADENSLILGDELCRGTEFNSAIRIFVSGLMMLNKKKCSHIFATHFHEITKMREISNLESLCMKHMEVQFNRELGTLVYNRKLKDGPGTNNYGLLVCKSLGLPEEFIKTAESIELDVKLLNENLLIKKSASYNSKKLKGNCELCNKDGVDIHHMMPQKIANKNGMIETDNYVFNKNHRANLMNICKECHLIVTKEDTIYVRKKTEKGYELFIQ